MKYVYPILSALVRSVKGYRCKFNKASILETFFSYSPSTEDLPIARDRCEDFCRGHDQCWGCSVRCVDAYTRDTTCEWNAIKRCNKIVRWTGKITGDVSHKQGIIF